jgi:hypothetical protein
LGPRLERLLMNFSRIHSRIRCFYHTLQCSAKTVHVVALPFAFSFAANTPL